MRRNGYIANQPTLAGCHNRKADEYIESLGLRNHSREKAPRPRFRSQEVRRLYDATQQVVKHIAQSMSQRQIKDNMDMPDFLKRHAEDLFLEHGESVWSEDNKHEDLIDAGSELFPINHTSEDRIVFLLRCWIAQRAYRKASRTTYIVADAEANSTSITNDDEIGVIAVNKPTHLFENAMSPPGPAAINPMESPNFPTLYCSPLAGVQNEDPIADASRQEAVERVQATIMVASDKMQACARSESSDENDSVISVVDDSSTHYARRKRDRTDVNNEESFGRPLKTPKQHQRASEPSHVGQQCCADASDRPDTRPNSSTNRAEYTNDTDASRSTGPDARVANLRRLSKTPGGTAADASKLPILSLERTEYLRGKIFSKLLRILRSEFVSTEVVGDFDCLVNNIWSENVKAHMCNGGRLKALRSICLCWLDMHGRFELFKEATGYQSNDPGEWPLYVQSLPDWQSQSIAMEAYNELGTWKWDKSDKGEWFEAQSLDNDLAIFFARLIHRQQCTVSFLTTGFAAYNNQLLRWFS